MNYNQGSYGHYWISWGDPNYFFRKKANGDINEKFFNKAFDDGLSAINDLINERFRNVSKEAKVNINLKALKAYMFEENNLTSIIEGLKTMYTKDEIVKQTAKEVQEEMKIQFERYQSAQREYVLPLDEDDAVNQSGWDGDGQRWRITNFIWR